MNLVRWSLGALAALVAVALFVVAWIFVPQLFLPWPDSGSLHVEEAEGEPQAHLEVNRTYREAPELAQALDTLVHTNETFLALTRDAEEVERIQAYLVEHHQDWVGLFAWRNHTVDLSYIT